MSMKIFTVFVTWHGYDVNALVKARNAKEAKARVVRGLEMEIRAQCIDRLEKDWFDGMDEFIAEVRKAPAGKVVIYDEGT